MSYMKCQQCGGYFGMIGMTFYTCGCGPRLYNTGNSIAGDPIYSDVPPSLPEAVAGNASAPVGDQKEQHLNPWDEPHTVKTPVGEHGPSCEFIKDGKGTCGPDCGQPSGVGEPQIYETADAIWKRMYKFSTGQDFPAGEMVSPAGQGIIAQEIRKLLAQSAAREVREGLRYQDIDAHLAHKQTCGTCEKIMLAALAAPAPKPELTSRDCICPTTCDGPEYNLKILPNCPWHSRAPKPAPPAEPLNVKEYLDLALRIQRVGAEHPYKLEHAGVNQGMWVCHCGEVLGDQPIDEIDAVAEQHISKFVAELVRRAAERKP